MNQNICNNCGGEYQYLGGRFVCQSCGSYMPEAISNEEMTLLYTAFQKLRLAEFYEAELEFDDVISKHPMNANAYWGRLMAKYGIKYERDFDGRMIPTCYAASIESLLDAEDYHQALKYADEESRAYYQKQADYIERVRREWIEKAKKEKPYDIFICYKDSDFANGIERTEDSVAAQELYLHLTSKGYRVFYSRETLRDKIGEKYEPYIFNALATAKVMLVYGSKPEYITSTWLKNEWTRYEKRIQKGEKKPNSLLVACEGFSPSELPTALSSMQCLNASEKNFYGDLDEAIANILHPKKSAEGYGAKKKFPTIAALLVLLAAIGGFLAWGFLSGELIRVQSVSDLKYGASVSAQSGGFKGRTELLVEDVSNSGEWASIVQNLHIETEDLVLYNMSLRRNGKAADWNGTDMTVSIPLPSGINEKRVAVYDIGGAVPKKLNFEVSDRKIVFTTTGLSEYLIAKREHNIVTDAAIAATCTKSGLTEGSHCVDCDEILVAQKVLNALGHHEGAAATCTTAQKCTRCNIVLEDAKGHTPGAAATCTTTQNCTVCHAQLAGKLPHTPGAEATCTTSQKCTVCNQELNAAFGHTPGTDGNCVTPSTCTVCRATLETTDVHTPGAAATCTTAQHCTLCNKELAAAKGHKAGSWVTVKQASKTENGLKERKCTVCQAVVESEVIPATGSVGLSFSENGGSYYVSGIGTCTDTDIVIPATYNGRPVTGIGDSAFQDCQSLTSITIPNGVTSIGVVAFSGCQSLTSITIPSGVTSIGDSAFFGCSSLTSITIPSGVTSIGGYAFSSCSSLTSITIPAGVTSIGDSAFSYCNDLASITIPSGVTSIGDSAFSHCSSLTSITIPSGVTSISDFTFNGCSSLTSIAIPDGITSIGDYAFAKCKSLTSIAIPSGVTSIGDVAFIDCSSLTSITIPSGVTSIGDVAFAGCSSLTSITIPSGVTSIGDSAFSHCLSLTSITIPASVTKIGREALAYCGALTSIQFGGTPLQWLEMWKGSKWKDGSPITQVIHPGGVISIG